MSEPIRFAVIGCGRMGRVRMRTVSESPEARLVAVTDIDPVIGKAAAAEFNVPFDPTVEALLARPDIDVVYISVPNLGHLDLVEQVAASKRHMFIEKPMARNVAEAEDIIAAAQRHGVTLKVGSNLRFFPNVQKAKELLDAQAIGRLMFLRAWIGHDGWNHTKWYGDPRISGGGTFLDNGCHIFDLARWFMGEVKNCTGTIQTALHPTKVEDNGYGIFEMEGGATAMIQSSWTDWAGYMYMEIYGEKGFLRIDSRKKNCLVVLGDRSGNEQLFDYSELPPSSYKTEFADYIDCLRTGRAPAPSGLDGLRAVAMGCGVYESARDGRRVGIPIEVPTAASAAK